MQWLCREVSNGRDATVWRIFAIKAVFNIFIVLTFDDFCETGWGWKAERYLLCYFHFYFHSKNHMYSCCSSHLVPMIGLLLY